MKTKSFVILQIIAFLILLNFSLSGQQILDEMELVDISNTTEITGFVLQDPNQALLIVKSQISGLRFLSNNFIHRLEQREPGKWFIFLTPGTHRISFQAEGFISAHDRFFFKAKEV